MADSMPLLGQYYDIPFEEIKEISMAGINIGPWGKDFPQADRESLQRRPLRENASYTGCGNQNAAERRRQLK